MWWNSYDSSSAGCPSQWVTGKLWVIKYCVGIISTVGFKNVRVQDFVFCIIEYLKKTKKTDGTQGVSAFFPFF